MRTHNFVSEDGREHISGDRWNSQRPAGMFMASQTLFVEKPMPYAGKAPWIERLLKEIPGNQDRTSLLESVGEGRKRTGGDSRNDPTTTGELPRGRSRA
jgi:hypothetical protein